MARPTKRTPEVEKKLRDLLRCGATRADAARAAGITYETLRQWEKDDAEFAEDIAQSESECAARMAARIYQEATRSDGDWRAAVEWLKRRRRDEWSERQEITLGKVREMTDDELIAFIKGGVGGSSAAGSAAAGPLPAYSNGSGGTARNLS
jgi:DNA-binding XRE family transcriptional regulator